MNIKLIVKAFDKLNEAKLIDNNLLNEVKAEILTNYIDNQTLQNAPEIHLLSNKEIFAISKQIEELLKIKLINKKTFNKLIKSIFNNYYILQDQYGEDWLERFFHNEVDLNPTTVYQSPTQSTCQAQQPEPIQKKCNKNSVDIKKEEISNQPIFTETILIEKTIDNHLVNNNSQDKPHEIAINENPKNSEPELNNNQLCFTNSTLNKEMLNLEPILSIENLTKQYKGRTKPAINKITFNVYPGQFHAFIGANGAGKTTTIKSIIDAYSKFHLSGSIKIGGNPNYTAEAKRLVGYIPEAANFPKKMKAGDYLISMCMLDGFRKSDAEKITKDVLSRLGLMNLINQCPASFSSGQKKKILLAQALIHKPSLLILDEPAANLDPLARDELFETLVSLQKEGTAIFISSHILDEIARFSTYVTILDGGEIVYNNPIETHTDLNELYKNYVKKGSVDLMIN